MVGIFTTAHLDNEREYSFAPRVILSEFLQVVLVLLQGPQGHCTGTRDRKDPS